MNLTELIKHPERMDRETLYDLRSLLALYPYYQTARVLMLQNLYLLHDSTFDEELRRAAIYITDRKVLFEMVEAAHYRFRTPEGSHSVQNDILPNTQKAKDAEQSGGSRTAELIDNFLGSLPDEETEKKPKERIPTPADAAVDYVAYLLESGLDTSVSIKDEAPEMKGQTLIDKFISQDGGRITLPKLNDNEERKDNVVPIPDDLCTETMAQIYVRQGRYSQALEIIKRLNLDNPKKGAYFADQIRFLEKLIVNNNKKQK